MLKGIRAMYTMFLVCAIFGGTIFVIQFVLAVIGAGGDDLDFGADIPDGFDIPDDLDVPDDVGDVPIMDRRGCLASYRFARS